MTKPNTHRAVSSAFLLILLLTCAAYWPGLHGPFLLDDAPNLEVIARWLDGHASLHEALTSTVASPYGRPLSMASFAVSAQLGGYTPFAFKLGNLTIHLLCGMLIFALVQRMASRDARLQAHPSIVGMLVAALWLLHPLNASTVLYAVQRMAQLATFFMLAGMLVYMLMRERIQAGVTPAKVIGMFTAVGGLTTAGFLAKENAVLLPVLCLVLELGCFPNAQRPRAINTFFVITLLIPAVIGVALFAQNPARLLGGYVSRDFNLQERLLTQSRVLCDYLGKIILPNPPRMGVYTDDFPISTGLLSPPSTLLAILVLIAITLAAFRLRRQVVALPIGWAIFLVGHAIESGFLPLELYFEHRNYLPMIGVLYALTGTCIALGAWLRTRDLKPGRIDTILALGVIGLFALGTHARARIWGSEGSLVESAVAAHPSSLRAQLAVIDAAVRHGDVGRAAVALDDMTRSGNAKMRAQGHLNRLNLSCALMHKADPQDLLRALQNAPRRISQDESEIFSLLFTTTTEPCEGMADLTLSAAANAFAENAKEQPDTYIAKAMLRRTAADFRGRHGDWTGALPLARRSWQVGIPPAGAVTLIQAQLATGDIAGAEKTWREAAARAKPGDSQDVAGLGWLRRQIDAAKNHGGSGGK